MLMNTGETPILSQSGLLTTIGWKVDGKITYALEGSVFIGGAVVQWLRDEMDWFKHSSQSEEYASRKPDTNGVYVVPAFVGLGTPYWDDDARGAIFGLTRGSDRHNITRAALYSIAYQSTDVIKTMKDDAGLDLPLLRVDGGASANDLLMQFQADILQCEVRIPTCVETTALGAGYLAGLGCGFWKNLDEIEANHSYAKTFKPTMSREEAERLYAGWQEAVKATRAFKPKL
jgi:glycerol kinase